MDWLKKLFPMAFTDKSDFSTLIVDVLIHLFVGFMVYIIGDLLTGLGAIGIVLAVICFVAVFYLAVSAVLAILNYCKVIK